MKKWDDGFMIQLQFKSKVHKDDVVKIIQNYGNEVTSAEIEDTHFDVLFKEEKLLVEFLENKRNRKD